MAFCHEHYGDQILRVEYEALTENPESEIRRMIDYAGLDWELACLDFHKTEGLVRTFSFGQVRQKIYTGSSQEWRNYEPWLGPLLDGLKDA